MLLRFEQAASGSRPHRRVIDRQNITKASGEIRWHFAVDSVSSREMIIYEFLSSGKHAMLMRGLGQIDLSRGIGVSQRAIVIWIAGAALGLGAASPENRRVALKAFASFLKYAPKG